MVVAATFVTLICTRSITRCVSIFFVEFQMQFSTDYSTTAWIHSLLDCTTMLCAPLGSHVGNRLSTRVAVMTGGLLSSLGLILSFFAPSLQFLYMSMGILTGLGFALSYTPAIAIVGTYFNEKKAMSYGIAMSGRGIGIFILPPLIRLLIDLYSWRGALLVLGGIISNLCVCGALMRPVVGQSEGKMENVKPILEEPDVQEDLKTVIFAENENKLDKEQEEENSLGDSCEDSKLKEVMNKAEEHEERSEDPMLLHPEITENVEDSKQESEPIDLKDLSVESDLNHTKSVLANLAVAKLQIADLQLINLMLTDTKEIDKQFVCSMLQNPELAALDVQSDSKLSKSKLCVLGFPESNLHRLTLASLKLADSDLTDSDLADTMLNNINVAKLMLAEPKLGTPKLPYSQLCEKVSSEEPFFPIKHLSKERRPKCCRFSSSSYKYNFLLKPDFLLLSLSLLFMAFGCSLPFVYLVPYSISVDLSHHQAVLLMSILGVMGIVGNITFGWISDRKCLRRFRVVTFLVPVGFGGLGCLFVPLLKTFPALVSFSVYYGFCDGAFMALIPVVTSDVVGSAHLSLALGVVSFLHAIPYLISPPIAGWLLDQSGSYTALFLLSGLSLLSSTSILTILALLRHCCRGRCVFTDQPSAGLKQ
ncbi:monocarboxylate transporter 12-B [Silurus meridionalis]|nr:monocarboxylate transporter 12-B [Silurus meridionalis]